MSCKTCSGTGHSYKECPVPLLAPKTPQKPGESEADYHRRLRYNEYMRAWSSRYMAVPENRARVYESQKRLRRSDPDSAQRRRGRRRGDKRRAELDALKDAPCMDCGNRFPPECMDFDHRPGEAKTKGIGALFLMPKRVAEEIKKCDLVCANCHRIRTWARKRANPKPRGVVAT